MKAVTPKKKLGQHFLNDLNIAEKITNQPFINHGKNVLEIGPGMGVLTNFLIKKKINLKLIEIDNEAVSFLIEKIPILKNKIISGNFIKMELKTFFGEENFSIIGNFPYNISSQIVFKTIENRDLIPFFCGMFQKEVAKRICEKPGSKAYGIISVLCQIFYHTEYLFSVAPLVFSPPPKVDSGVIALTRKINLSKDFDEKLLFKVVKLSFQQRRKTLRNSLKTLGIPKYVLEDSIFDLRPEKLSGDEFIALTKKVENAKV
jgi:16S rRNA (adenine1518-N6/adenine1519-N6)-dimethyltransferase